MAIRYALLGAALLACSLVSPAQPGDATTGARATCESNLYTTKLALTMWMVDNNDVYPTALDALTPDYLLQNMLCPLAGAKLYDYELLDSGKGFQLTCTADHTSEGATEPLFEADDPEMEAAVRDNKPEP